MHRKSTQFFYLFVCAFFFPHQSFGQNGSLSGTVYDKSNKQALYAVNVVLQGTTLGVSTDFDGKYSISNVPPGTYTLIASYLGYKKLIQTNVRIDAGKRLKQDLYLTSTVLTIDQVVEIVGEKPLVDIEQTQTEQRVSAEVIEAAPSRQLQGILNTQSGVVLNPEGLSIRGGRTYETAFYIDGVSATDPLAGTGFGIDLGSNSVEKIDVRTGGGDVSIGDGTSGIVSTTTRSGGEKWEFSLGHRRDNLGIRGLNYETSDFVWNNSIYEGSAGGKLNLFKQDIRLFSSFKVSFDDQYFKTPANQVTSSLYPNSFWSPRQSNRWAGNLKLNYNINPRKRLVFNYLRSITINQDVNMLRITGNDVPFLPGFQYSFSLQPDNANTYTHDTNLESIKWTHTTSTKFSYDILASRLFVKLRADANGRPWRPVSVDSEFDPDVIIDYPVSYFNEGDSAVFVNPGPGLFNNGGIATLWHNHYVEEYGLRFTGKYYYSKSGGNRFSFGTEIKAQEMQWIDIISPWIGAPIILADGSTTQSFRLGDYSDVWKVNPLRGAFYASNKVKYKGLVAEVGGRMEYWFPGKFVDDAVKDDRSPIRDEIRADYMKQTLGIGNRRFKMRLLPKISASFPIRENQVMFFNYNHSMILPHPSFIYAGLNPLYQDRSVLSRVGNPNLNPEVDISYELGLRSQISNNDALSLSAYWKDKYDFVTAASIQIKDATGRELSRTMRINSDYARVRGLEVSYIKRISDWFNGQISAAYMVATGQSSSASESLNQILNTGNRQDTEELFLAWDSPLDLKAFATFTRDKKNTPRKYRINHYSLYVEGVFRTGRRYTPYILTGYEPISDRPIWEPDPDPNKRWSELGASNFWIDINLRKWWMIGETSRLEFIIQLTNLLNNLNTVIPNPVTGRAFEDGDNVPSTWRDPQFLDPRDRRSSNRPPDNPARYRAPRHIMFGLNFRF